MHNLLKKIPEKTLHRFWMVLFLIACHFMLTAEVCKGNKETIMMFKTSGAEPGPFIWFVNVSAAQPRVEEGSEIVFFVEFDLQRADPFWDSPPDYGILKSTMVFDYGIVPTGSSPTNPMDFIVPGGRVRKEFEFKLWQREGAKMRVAIRIRTRDNNVFEKNRNFTLKIMNPRISGYSFRVYNLDLKKYVTHTLAQQIIEIKQGSVEGTIVDNDGMVMFIESVSTVKKEGNSGRIAYTFKVSRLLKGRSNPLNPSLRYYSPQKVDYEVRGAAGNFGEGGEWVPGANAKDFGGDFPSGQVTFNLNEKEKIITVYSKGDTVYEFDDTFWVALKNPSALTNLFVADKAMGKILNDDLAQGTFSITAVPSFDMVAGEFSRHRSFTLRYQRPPGEEGDVFVDYELKGRGTYPTDTDDFLGILVDPPWDTTAAFENLNPVTKGSVKFPPGKTRAKFWLEVIHDDVIEPDETFEVLLTPGTRGITIENRAIGTILNDDFPKESANVSISTINAEQTEGHGGGKNFTFKAELVKKYPLHVSVDWSVAGSGTNSADANDFEGGVFPKGKVVFKPDEVLKNITVKVSGDTTQEPDETFTVTLSNPGKKTVIIADQTSAVGTILNDDKSIVPPPPVSKGIKARLLRVVPLSGVNPVEFNSLTTNIQTARGTGPGGLPHSLVIDSIPAPSAISSGASTKYTLGVTDDYAHPLTFAWTSSCSGLGSNGTFADAGAQNPTWTAPQNFTGSSENCTISVDIDDGSFGLDQSGSFTQSVTSPVTPLTVVGSTGIVDNDGNNATLIEIRIDVSGTNTISALLDGAGGNNTAIFLLGGDGSGGTIFDSSGSPFTLISLSNGATITDGTTNAILQRAADSVFFKITFNMTGQGTGGNGNMTLNSFSGYNCGSSQSNCP